MLYTYIHIYTHVSLCIYICIYIYIYIERERDIHIHTYCRSQTLCRQIDLSRRSNNLRNKCLSVTCALI